MVSESKGDSAIARFGTWTILAAIVAAIALWIFQLIYSVAVEPEMVAREAAESAERRAADGERAVRLAAERMQLDAERRAHEEARQKEAERRAAAEQARADRELANQRASSAIMHMHPMIARWDDAIAVASASPRIALPRQIEVLQSIRREFLASPPTGSPCVSSAHRRIANAMALGIDAHIKFLAQDDASAEALLRRYSTEMRAVMQDIAKCVQ